MYNKEKLLAKCNALNQKDKYFSAFANAVGIVMDEQDNALAQNKDDFFFDTCSEAQLKKYEKEARITPLTTATLEDRRYALIAKWISEGKCDVALLQSVANSWEYGKTSVDYIDNKIQINFIDELGIPDHLDRLKSALNEAKPAHIPIYYIFNYLLVSDVSSFTVDNLQLQYINEFAF